MGPPALKNVNDILNDAKDVVTPKVDKVDILTDIKRTAKTALYIHVLSETKRERWLIDYLYSIL